MAMMTRRWLARGSFALMVAAVALLVAAAGWRSLAQVALAATGGCAVLAGAYWFLANPGVLRWAALVLMVAAPTAILVKCELRGQGNRGHVRKLRLAPRIWVLPHERADLGMRDRHPGQDCGSSGPALGWAGDLVPAPAAEATRSEERRVG